MATGRLRNPPGSDPQLYIGQLCSAHDVPCIMLGLWLPLKPPMTCAQCVAAPTQCSSIRMLRETTLALSGSSR